MKKITLNKENIIKKIGEGRESIIYLYKEENGTLSALKLLKDEIKFFNDLDISTMRYELTDEMRKNKETKLDILSKEKCFNDEAKLIDLVYDEDGKFIGYTREYIKNIKKMSEFTFDSKKNKLNLLYSLRNKIEELNKNDIYIGDIGSDNFYVENNQIKLLDIDSLHVKGNDFSIKTYLMKIFLENNENIENIDNYCFNFYTIAFYEKIALGYIYSVLLDDGLPKKFKTKENKEILKTMLEAKDYEKKYVLDYMKNGLFD